MIIVALTAGMGCGKSTAVDVFKKHFECATVKFAQPLYDIQELAYKRIESVYKRPDNFVKDRQFLQWVGTNWGRSLNENLWVELWKAEVNRLARVGYEMVVTDDLRFDNEAEAVRSFKDSTIIKILRSNNVTHAVGGEGIKSHASEAGIDSKFVDRVIDNNGTLWEYESKLNEIILQLKGNR